MLVKSGESDSQVHSTYKSFTRILLLERQTGARGVGSPRVLKNFKSCLLRAFQCAGFARAPPAQSSCRARQPARVSSSSSSSLLLSEKVQAKLLCDAKTDMPVNRHEPCTAGMRHVPVDAQPDMHSGTDTHVGCDSGQQSVAPTAHFGDSGGMVVPGMQPGSSCADEPLTAA